MDESRCSHVRRLTLLTHAAHRFDRFMCRPSLKAGIAGRITMFPPSSAYITHTYSTQIRSVHVSSFPEGRNRWTNHDVPTFVTLHYSHIQHIDSIGSCVVLP